jgi:hypothetical protein
VASVVGVGPAPPAPPPLPGATAPVVSANCCRFDSEFVAESVPILDGDVNGVDGTIAERLPLLDGAIDVEEDGIDVREEAAEDTAGGGVSGEEIDGSEIIPEYRSTGSGGGRELL